MALPGFTAATAVYRSTGRYCCADISTARAPALAAAVGNHDQDFCHGKELDHNYPHPEDCGRYISCDLSGRAQDMPCVNGLHFMTDDTRWGHCDYPHIANCET